MTSTIERLLEQLAAFAAGSMAREDVRRWFTPYHVAIPPEADDDAPRMWSPDADDCELFWALAWLFEDDSISESEHRRVATRLLACHRQLRRADDTLRLLPLLRRQDYLCQLVQKHQAGVVSQMGLQSSLRKRFHQEEVGPWLAAASNDALQRLCEALEIGDYMVVDAWLSAPPA